VAYVTSGGGAGPPYPDHMSRTSESGTPIERVCEAKDGARATVGEACDARRDVRGLYQPVDVY
jgi:hypothetical protein